MDNQTVHDAALAKVKHIIQYFNDTFEIEPNITKDEVTQEEVTNGLKIKSLKTDGGEFLDEIFDTLAGMVHFASQEHELVYDHEHNKFAIAKKKITYEIL